MVSRPRSSCPRTTSRAATAFSDPLHLGIPLVDQDCSGEALLVVGYGNTVAPLGTAVANSSAEGLRYLRSDGSCATVLGPEREADAERTSSTAVPSTAAASRAACG